jgi:hypothetical protein
MTPFMPRTATPHTISAVILKIKGATAPPLFQPTAAKGKMSESSHLYLRESK